MSEQPRHPVRARRTLLKAAAVATAVPGIYAAKSWAQVVPGPAVFIQGNDNTVSWAINSDPAIYTAAYRARFTNILPNPNSAAFSYAPEVGTGGATGLRAKYVIQAGQTTQDILGIGIQTPVWGYQNYQTAAPTYPGRSFKMVRNQAANVVWKNNLSSANGQPLPHLLPVDQTLFLAQAHNTGVPIAVHHHGGDTAFEFDGGPDQWTTPQRVEIGPGIIPASALPGNYPPGTQTNMDATTGLDYTYLNAQEASLHWYHDHGEGTTRTTVHAGLAGLYYVTDANEAALRAANVIPSEQYETTLVLQDRTFDAQGRLTYAANPADSPTPTPSTFPANNPTTLPEVFGDIIVVNGKAWPKMNVEPRPYRIRLLGGADSRFFTLKFQPPMVTKPLSKFATPGALPKWYVIGNDLGFMNQGVDVTNTGITIAPGERIDMVVDFTGLTGNYTLTNSAATPFPAGTAPTGGATQVMRFDIVLPKNTAVPAPVTANLPLVSLRRTADTRPLPSYAALLATPVAATRKILLGEGVDAYGRVTPLLGVYDPVNPAKNLGTLSFMDPPTETPALNTTEVWEFWNVSADAHPVHMHLSEFRVLDRQAFRPVTPTALPMPNGYIGQKLTAKPSMLNTRVPAPLTEQGPKDTVVCPPGFVTRILVSFKRPGTYVYHCHILSHEEHDMMRWFKVV